MDWSQCSEVESRPGVVSGAWVVKGTRVQADAIVDNANDGHTAEDIVEDLFPTVPIERVRRIIEFARQHEAYSAR